MRKVTRMVPIQEMPSTFQYFFNKSEHIYSQLDQDGVIAAIFDLIGTRDKFFVEIGGGNSFDNSYYLRKEKQWEGLLFNSGNYLINDDE